MATTGAGGGSLPLNFYLTPQQQHLLFQALNANRQPSPGTKTGLSLSPNLFKPTSSQGIDTAGFQESPFLDNYDYDLEDSGFDFSFAGESGHNQLMGDYPADTAASMKSESSENDLLEKRSHPDDEEDDESPGNESKRHESGDKVPKKPGRKPLTSEPTSKRKAQNRAAQRAFRERKEKHVKDLETKVDELEKASEAANSENSLLRAQVDRITNELNHYKRQMALLSGKPTSQGRTHPFGTAGANNITDLNFQFEFPKFGSLPGQPANKPPRPSSHPISPQSNHTPSPAASVEKETKPQAPGKPNFTEGFAKFSGLMTPSMSSSTVAGRSGSGSDVPNLGLHGDASSPSNSSHSNTGPSSSCGTSPEAFTQSPTSTKPAVTFTSIGEQQHTIAAIEQPFAHFADSNVANSNGLDWLVQQNGGQFDPQLFGDYREPQDNILSNPSFDDIFNEKPGEADFINPYNMGPGPHKTNLIDQIDAQKYAIDEGTFQHEGMRFNSIWHKMQTFPEMQEGDFDLDGLCSELTKKAKCSGHGPVVAQGDFDTILNKYMGKNHPANVADKAGIRVLPLEKQQSMAFSIPSTLQRSV